MKPELKKEDLDIYLKACCKWINKSRLDARYGGGSDMTKKIDRWAVEAMNRHHNP
jgi:hypothetical protein